MNTKHQHTTQYTYAQDVRDDHRFEPTEAWLTSCANIPKWNVDIPICLGINEPVHGHWIDSLEAFFAAPLGRIVWHMFCVSAYHCPKMRDVDRINKTVVVSNVNVGGNSVLNNTRVSEIVYDARKKGRVILPPGIDASFARLFNYYEGFKKNRPVLFNLQARNKRFTYSDCGVCGTRQGLNGLVLEGDGPKRQVTEDMVKNFDPARHVVPGHRIHVQTTDNRI